MNDDNPMLCVHANEGPRGGSCACRDGCYCKTPVGMCKKAQGEEECDCECLEQHTLHIALRELVEKAEALHVALWEEGAFDCIEHGGPRRCSACKANQPFDKALAKAKEVLPKGERNENSKA